METDHERDGSEMFHENTAALNYDKISIDTVELLTKNDKFITDITPEYIPLIIDKILDESQELFIVDSKDDIVNKYSDLLNKFVDTKDTLVLYSPSLNNPFPGRDNVQFTHLTDQEIDKLNSEDYRAVIIGDSQRFLWNKMGMVPHFYSFADILLSLVGIGKPKYNLGQESLMNLRNESKATLIINDIKRLIHD